MGAKPPSKSWAIATPLSDGSNGDWRRVVTALLIVSVTMVAGCGRTTNPAASERADSAAVVVSVVQPQRKSLRRFVDQPGTIQADEEAAVAVKLPAYVRRVCADIGQRVKGPVLDSQGKEIEPGELLAELSIPEMEEE